MLPRYNRAEEFLTEKVFVGIVINRFDRVLNGAAYRVILVCF